MSSLELKREAGADAPAFSLSAAEDRLIVALDVPTAAEALALAQQLKPVCKWVKVGLELYLADGAPVVASLRAMGFEVFLDLKLHDIPNTVAGAVRTASRAGASLLTVHAAGGPKMIRAAADAAAAIRNAPKLLAVTVLTSMDEAQLAAVGVQHAMADQVKQLGVMAIQNGANGLVCSPRETSLLCDVLGDRTGEPLLVVPGIRPAGSAADDQARAETPADAIRSGASMLVVGRPITRASDPAAAAARVLEEIRNAL